MTKKHFERAAQYVREMGTGANVASVVLCDLFSEFNPRFDRQRFLRACRGEDATDSAGRTVRYSERAA